MRDTTWPSDDDDDRDWRLGDEPHDDWDSDADADPDDDVDNDVENCPECGMPIFMDASICPRCGTAITVDTSPWSGRSVWWVWLGLIGIAMTIFALFF